MNIECLTAWPSDKHNVVVRAGLSHVRVSESREGLCWRSVPKAKSLRGTGARATSCAWLARCTVWQSIIGPVSATDSNKVHFGTHGKIQHSGVPKNVST